MHSHPLWRSFHRQTGIDGGEQGRSLFAPGERVPAGRLQLVLTHGRNTGERGLQLCLSGHERSIAAGSQACNATYSAAAGAANVAFLAGGESLVLAPGRLVRRARRLCRVADLTSG